MNYIAAEYFINLRLLAPWEITPTCVCKVDMDGLSCVHCGVLPTSSTSWVVQAVNPHGWEWGEGAGSNVI